jgi:hypothetical protein
MNNPINSYPGFIALCGLILFLFGISFIPLKIGKLLEDFILTGTNEEQLAEEINFQSLEHDLLNREMNDLNAIVNNTSREINLLILQSRAINDTINKLIEKSKNDLSLLDTIQNLYNHDILSIEIQIDSLNQIFEEKSNELFLQVKAFNLKDRDLKIIQAKHKREEKLILLRKVFFLVFSFFFIVCFLSGVFLFIYGVKKWRSEYEEAKTQKH